MMIFLMLLKKVLRQRRSDYTNTNNTLDYRSTASASPKLSTSGDNQRKSTHKEQQHRTPPSSRRSKSKTSATTILYDDILSSTSDSPPPLPDHEQDIILSDSRDKSEYLQTERYLSTEIGCPIKLLTSKQIISEHKNNQCSKAASKPMYYYCPTKNPNDIFQLLRWQNEEKTQSIKPLIVYASVRDAHDASKQNFENNQFCIFRVHLFHSGVIDGDLLPDNRLRLNNPLTMRFDRIWIYIYDF